MAGLGHVASLQQCRAKRLDAHAALIEALKEAGMDAGLRSMQPLVAGIVPPNAAPSVVHIMIGSKS